MQSSQYSSNPLTLIVEREIVELEKFLPQISQAWQVVSIGKELSSFLIVSSDGDQSRIARQWLQNELRAKTPGPVICTDIDLLFHPSLKLDPLGLFRQLSRFTKLIVLWPGEYKGGVLTYAQPEHHHYHSWRNPEDIDIKGVNDAL
ncbi:MAG: BREX-3 system P-loop-containing protein BrxF [Anaerolineales bacterium]